MVEVQAESEIPSWAILSLGVFSTVQGRKSRSGSYGSEVRSSVGKQQPPLVRKAVYGRNRIKFSVELTDPICQVFSKRHDRKTP